MRTQIKQLASSYYNEVVNIRRHIHQHPELSFHEHNTSAYIAEKLEEWQIPYKKGVADTGVLAFVESGKPGLKRIGLRADMDALPVQEENQVSYKSKYPKVMHACGHDMHTANLLGVAKILNTLREDLPANYILVFQPGEELLPGGAAKVLEDPTFQKHKPDIMIGLHVYPDLPIGKIGYKSGEYMASTDEIYIRLSGRGGHAAMPHKLDDSVLATSQLIVALQQITARFIPTQVPSVLSFGKIDARGATNVIPSKVDIAGTFRTMNEEWRMKAHEKIEQIALHTAKQFNCKAEVDIVKGYPTLYNAPELVQPAIVATEKLLGHDAVEPLDIRMTAEDFAYYAREMPALFFRVGTNNLKNEFGAALHSPSFNIEEKALELSMQTMSYLAIELAKQIR